MPRQSSIVTTVALMAPPPLSLKPVPPSRSALSMPVKVEGDRSRRARLGGAEGPLISDQGRYPRHGAPPGVLVRTDDRHRRCGRPDVCGDAESGTRPSPSRGDRAIDV